MKQNTGNQGQRPHIVTLQVKPGHAYIVNAATAVRLGGGYWSLTEESRPESGFYGLPAGRGA